MLGILFPVGALGGAILWSLNLRIMGAIKRRQMEAAAAQITLSDAATRA